MGLTNKRKFIERVPTSIRFSRAERKRIWALTPNLSEYVKTAALSRLAADERCIREGKILSGGATINPRKQAKIDELDYDSRG